MTCFHYTPNKRLYINVLLCVINKKRSRSVISTSALKKKSCWSRASQNPPLGGGFHNAKPKIMLFFTIRRHPIPKASLRLPKQLLRTMKLTILFLTAVCLHVSAAGYGQKVTISGKDLPLEKVFSVIKKQTDYVCFYGYDILKDAKKVSLDFKNAEVEEELKAAL